MGKVFKALLQTVVGLIYHIAILYLLVTARIHLITAVVLLVPLLLAVLLFASTSEGETV